MQHDPKHKCILDHEVNGSFLGSIWDFQSLMHTFLDPITIVPLQQMTVLFN